MSYIFNEFGYKATTLNIGDLSNWNDSKVTNHDGFNIGATSKITSLN